MHQIQWSNIYRPTTSTCTIKEEAPTIFFINPLPVENLWCSQPLVVSLNIIQMANSKSYTCTCSLYNRLRTLLSKLITIFEMKNIFFNQFALNIIHMVLLTVTRHCVFLDISKLPKWLMITQFLDLYNTKHGWVTRLMAQELMVGEFRTDVL